MRYFIILLFSFSITVGLSQSEWLKIKSGAEYTIALKNDGTLWSWGDNQYGQLGLGDNIIRNTPTKIGNETDWAELSCGGYHVLALKNDGSLWTWGLNSFKQLGNNSSVNSNIPILVSSEMWLRISSGQANSFGIKSDGSLWAWGYNNGENLGLGIAGNIAEPMQVGNELDWKDVECGGSHNLALKVDSSAFICGNNTSGQGGLGDNISVTFFSKIGDSKWLKLSAGFDFSLGLMQDSTLWAWGSNFYGQLGVSGISESNVPVKINNSKFSQIESGMLSAFAIDSQNQLFSWGANLFGNLGDGTNTQKNIPTFIDENVALIASGNGVLLGNSIIGNQTFLLKNGAKNVICTSGANNKYQLGNGTNENSNVFTCETGNTLDINVIDSNDKPLNVYPNPSTGNFFFNLHQFDKKVKIEVFTIDGLLIFNEIVDGNQNYNLEIKLPPSIFIYRVISDSDFYSGKIIKE
jgi:alpha-tubulin suppressor-like RCC1 family protein